MPPLDFGGRVGLERILPRGVKPYRHLVFDSRECPLCLIYSRSELFGGKVGAGDALRVLWKLGRTQAFVESFRLQALQMPRIMKGIKGVKDRLNRVMLREARNIGFRSYSDLISKMAIANGVDWRIPGYELDVGSLSSMSAGLVAIGRSLAELASLVEESQSIYVGLDNAGEAVIDILGASWLAERGHDVVVVARSEPYEVDVTHGEAIALAEALGVGDDKLRIIGTGSMYPPLYRGGLAGEAQRALERADLIIGKGIGNLEAALETLDQKLLSRTLSLLRAKCTPLSRIAGGRGVAVATLAADFLKTLNTPGYRMHSRV